MKLPKDSGWLPTPIELPITVLLAAAITETVFELKFAT
jgi:hypothetical protein